LVDRACVVVVTSKSWFRRHTRRCDLLGVKVFVATRIG
jgi:hypothetical protein